MRENRPYGLEGGESGKPDFPTPMPILVKSTWVAGEARSKINAVMGLTPIRVRTFW